MTPAERLQLSVLAENTHTTLQTLPSAMQLIYQADARWHERIGSSEETASKQIVQFYELLNGSLINAVSITVSPADYFAATTAAINAVYALYDKGVAAVDEQLVVRIEQTTKLRNFMLFFSSAMFLLVTYLFCCFYLSVKRVVLLLRQATQRVAHGDLTSRICLPVHDELSAIGADFNLMVTSLHDIVQQVHGSALSLSALSAQLTAHAKQSAQNANHIASTAGEVAAGADNNRTAVSTTASAVEEIAASIDHTQSNASSISASSLQTAVTAKQGSAIIAQTIDQINIVKQTVADSSASIRNLELHSVEIGKIIETISTIASQTDLLALNAAIESARAGEQGRGFAVVAVEVRKLAEQSQQAATQIGSLIGEIQSVTKHSASAMQHGSLEVDRGVKIAGSAGASFNEIVQMIDDVSEKMSHMTDAMQEIAKGSQEIVVAVRSVDTISETAVEQTKSISASIDMQAASMREITAASHALLELATQLETSVNAFTLGDAHCISGEPQHSK